MTILFQKMREIPLLYNVLYVGDASENKVSVAKIITKCSQLRNPRPFPQVSAIGGLLFIAIGLTQNAFRHPCAWEREAFFWHRSIRNVCLNSTAYVCNVQRTCVRVQTRVRSAV